MTGLQALASVPAMLALAGSPASTGTGIQPGPVCLATTIHPGAARALPPVTVQDTGSGGESIALHIQKPAGHGTMPGRPVPPSWVTFTYPRKWLVLSQSSVPLGPGATAPVPASLAVPSAAAPGRYVAWIGAAPAGSGTAGKANFGAEAFTYLEFTVAKVGSPARHAACVTPGVKQASPAKSAHPAASAGKHPKGQLIPAKARKYVPDAIIAAVVLGALMFLRRKGLL
jgi:hypothetical protein